jgi:hypothetical protein
MNRILGIVFCFILSIAAFVPAAHADEWNQKTKLTFSTPVQVPGAVLPAGSYWFELAGGANRYIMQIFSDDWSKLYASTLTVSTSRGYSDSLPEVQLAERPNGQPDALVKMYYPGFQTGYEFVYHPREERELTRDAKLDVLADPNGIVSMTTIPGV